MMPFAGYKDFADCVQKQIAKGKDKESASKICGSVKSKTEVLDTKTLEADIMKLEIEKDTFIMEITKSLIKKMAGKLEAKTSPNLDDVRTLQDLVWMYRSEKRDNEPKMI